MTVLGNATLFLLYLLFIGQLALALPSHLKRDGTAPVSAATLVNLTPFTQFARAAYCDPSLTKTWTCGAPCKALPTFQPTLTGGDGNEIQFFIVGFWPLTKSVIVAHQGTNPSALMSDLTDLNTIPRAMDPILFPGLPVDIKAHSGFTLEHAKTASLILREVKRLLAAEQATSVVVVGHSLGGALAELDSLFFKLNLPVGTNIKGVTYGTPRVGNKEFAAFFDRMVPDFTRVNNQHDLVPTVPPRFLGFSHPSGEIHLLGPGQAVTCAGADDDVDKDCTDKTVSNILKGSIKDHLGPYEGLFIGGAFCDVVAPPVV